MLFAQPGAWRANRFQLWSTDRMQPPLINLVFLGCGGITRAHSRTLRRFRSDVRCFYASRDPSRAAAMSRRFAGAGSFQSYAAALVDDRVSTVFVATPPDSHLQLTLAALEHGKHAIVEKPAFLRAADVALVRAAEARSGRRVLVAENYCYKPLARALQQIIRSGVLGEIRFLELNAVKYQAPGGWRADPMVAGGGALFEGGIHWIDLLANLGLRIEAVHGFRPGDWSARERSMLVIAEYEEGAVGTLTHSWEIPSPLRGLRFSHIYGTRGSVTFESNGLVIFITGECRRVMVPGLRDIKGYQAMFRNFLAVLQTGTEPLMSLDRAQRGLELIESAYCNVMPRPELEAVS
jgi:predicted dehydrogenase